MTVHNVLDYGGQGDYVDEEHPGVDNTVPIQNAINAASSETRGGVVYLPPGKYGITGALQLQGSAQGTGKMIVFQGDGACATEIVARFAGTGPGAISGVGCHFKLCDFALTAPSSRYYPGIYLDWLGAQTTLERLYVSSFSAGVLVGQNVCCLTLYECSCSENVFFGLMAEGQSGNLNNIRIIGGRYSGNGACSADMGANIYLKTGWNHVIEGANLETPRGRYALRAESCSGLTINSCYLEGWQDDPPPSNVQHHLSFENCDGVVVNATMAWGWTGHQRLINALNVQGLTINSFSCRQSTLKENAIGIFLDTCSGFVINAACLGQVGTGIYVADSYGAITAPYFPAVNVPIGTWGNGQSSMFVSAIKRTDLDRCNFAHNKRWVWATDGYCRNLS